jgi:hypothetical protein
MTEHGCRLHCNIYPALVWYRATQMKGSARCVALSFPPFKTQTAYRLSLATTENIHSGDTDFLSQVTSNFIYGSITQNCIQYHPISNEEKCVWFSQISKGGMEDRHGSGD